MIYDLVIIGGGPAGITAAIYASRNNLKTLILTENLGGTISSKAVSIENYPGFPSISGIELIEKFNEHLNKQENVLLEIDKVLQITKEENFLIETENNNEYLSRTIIIASGAKPRKLNIKGESEFLGKGVSYCSVCDGAFFNGKEVAIIGGGNGGFESAIFMKNIASRIYVLTDKILADEKNQKIVKEADNIEILIDKVEEIRGENKVSSIILSNGKELKLDGVFINAGYFYETDYLSDLVDFNEKGEIIVNEANETKTEALFAAGDITNSKVKQIVCATCSGACAALSVYNYLKND